MKMKPSAGLQTKRKEFAKEPKKSAEILSFTNAAVQAISAANRSERQQASPNSVNKISKYGEQMEVNSMCSSGPSFSSDNSLNDQRDVLELGSNLTSLSSTSSQDRADCKMDTSSLESSFNKNTAQRVRIPSRLLREIKSPLERSRVATDVQQPTALVVRHVDGPSAWISMATNTSLTDHIMMSHGEPTSTTTVFTHQITQAKDLDDQEIENHWQTVLSPKHKEKLKEKHDKHVKSTDNEQVVSRTAILKKTNDATSSVLCQGAPITGAFVTNAKTSDSTKAKSFSLSERERLLKEEFMKRKDVKSAPVKRVVQPTIIPMKETEVSSSNTDGNAVVSAAAIAAAAASAATAPFLQIQHGLESQISALVSSLNVLHEQQSKIEHQKADDQELRLQEQLDIRLKKLEEVQGQILELQNSQRNNPPGYPAQPHQPFVPPGYPAQPHQSFVPYPCVSKAMTSVTSSHGVQDPYQKYSRPPLTVTVAQTPPVSYVPAAQLVSQAQNQTSDIVNVPSSKFKLIKNTKTQTSPQDYSPSFKDSPLQTPLPRKRPPLPISRDLQTSRAKALQYCDLPREKRVHFNEPDPGYPATRMSQHSTHHLTRLQSQADGHVTTRPLNNPRFETDVFPQREKIQAKEHGFHDKEEVMNDLSKIKTDLKSVMTETEKIKGNLSLHKIRAEIDQKFSQINKGPSPLDSYLSSSRISRRPDQNVTDKLTAAPVSQHYADAEHILRNVQMKRSNLECNLDAIVRQSDEEHLYAVVDTMIQEPQRVETLRIRKDVDRIIKELNSTVKKEIEVESNKVNEVESTTSMTTKQEDIKHKGKYQPITTKSKREPRKSLGKENLPDKTTAKKQKTVKPSFKTVLVKPESKPVTKPVPKSSTTNQTYLTSVYGRQSYHPQRITSKAPYLHYQSPVNPRTAALTSAILGAGSRMQPSKPAHHDETPKPIQIRNERAIEREEKPRYYFHPDIGMSHVVPSGEGRVSLNAPVEGHLVPMAIPLGKPKTDQSLRLPLTNVTSAVVRTESTTVRPTTVVRKDKTTDNKPNVAVITIRDEEIVNDSMDHQQKKGKLQPKRRADLEVQILPQMDIDSFTESNDSIDIPPHLPRVLDISEPFTRPEPKEYDDFRNYLTVRDTDPSIEDKDDDDDEVPRIRTPENPVMVKGHTEKDHLYHGPPFPPQHPLLPRNVSPGVLDADNRVNDALEDRAVEWVEQELLARIVSEMNRPLPDPTLATRPESSPDSSIVTDDGDLLAATIGLGGIQLFVDAGVPVDRDFVAKLIRDVIAEQIVSTLGYPKPTATPRPPQVDVQEETSSPEPVATPVSTPVPTPVYTPVESESSEPQSPSVATPDPTPIPSESSDVFESEGETTPVKELSETKDKSESEVSEARSPVPTPMASPTGSHTPTVSVSTPEPSTREPDSDIGSLVYTPQVTERTASPPPTIVSTPPVESSLTTPKPPTVTRSPSSITTSTLSSTPGTTSTMTTIDEELSEGQLLQPYVHLGQFSEGEYTAVSPGLVQLAKQRTIPDEPLDVLGKDEDSRNHLIRVALNGLLRRNGSSSSTVSTVSTLKDADDIREDSLADYTHSEGEIVFPRDQVPVLYGPRTTAGGHTLPDSTSSEGELVSTLHSRGTSPGEFRSVLRADTSHHSPGEISTGPKPQGRLHTNTTNEQVDKEQASPENTDSRSLHTSDLHQQEKREEKAQQSVPNIKDPTKIPESRGSQYDKKETLPFEKNTKINGIETSRLQPIHIPIPPTDVHDSSLNSDERPGDEQEDTYGDVSSISGGDF